MPDLPTADELQRVAQYEILRRRPDLNDFAPGSALDAITGAGAVQVDEALRIMLDKLSGAFASTAEGVDLDEYAADWFGLTRLPATAAQVTLTIQRVSQVGVFKVLASDDFTATTDGLTVAFRLGSDLTFGSDEDTKTATATCTETGRVGNLPANSLTRSSLTVAHGDRAAGGSDVETDDEFRARIRQYLPSVSLGTIDAIERVAKSVPGVRYATADESSLTSLEYASLYVGDPDGGGNDLLAADVQAAIDSGARACGVEVRAFASARQEEALALTIHIRQGVDQSKLLAAIAEAIVALGDSIRSNEVGYLSRIQAAVHGIGDQIRWVEVTSPSTNIMPTEAFHAIRYPTSLLTVTFSESP